MKLVRVSVEGYRSIRERLDLYVDPRVTVVMGPNDHGKTNLLAALRHLNQDHPFDANRDLNFDSMDEEREKPCVAFEFTLSPDEKKEFLAQENGRRWVSAAEHIC